MDSNVMVAATEAIKKAGGLGIPTVKPWNVEMIREKMALVKDAGAFAAAMDIDAAGLPFLKNFRIFPKVLPCRFEFVSILRRQNLLY